jgi:cysteine-rich repeat protein
MQHYILLTLAVLSLPFCLPTGDAIAAELCNERDARSSVYIRDANGDWKRSAKIVGNPLQSMTAVEVKVVEEYCGRVDDELRWLPIEMKSDVFMSEVDSQLCEVSPTRKHRKGYWLFEARGGSRLPYALQTGIRKRHTVYLKGSCPQKAKIEARFVQSEAEPGWNHVPGCDEEVDPLNCNPHQFNPLYQGEDEIDGCYFFRGAWVDIDCPPCAGGQCLVVRDFCGDGIVQAPERCDDGNDIDDDGCRNDCTFCGDGQVDRDATPPEVCDDGNDVDVGDACNNSCLPNVTIRSCGNGIVEPQFGEKCDDGNGIDGDSCRNDCTFCGDGVLQPNLEQCDPTDPADPLRDVCLPTCRVPECEIVGWFRDPKFRKDGSVRGNGRMEVVEALRPFPNNNVWPVVDLSQSTLTFSAEFAAPSGTEFFQAEPWGAGTTRPLTYFEESGNRGYAFQKGDGRDSMVLKARQGFVSVNYDIPQIGAGPMVQEVLASGIKTVPATVDMRIDGPGGHCVIARSVVNCRTGGGPSLDCPLQ